MYVFNFNHVPDWVFKELLIVPRPARCGILEDSGLLLVMNSVYAVDFAFTAFFSRNVLSILALLANLLGDRNRLLWCF